MRRRALAAASGFDYPANMNHFDFQVRKSDLHSARFATPPDSPLSDGQVQLAIARFALTSNNITYAAFGDAMNYWQFFPTAEDGWGCIPVWGFATVLQSRCAGIAPGERFYGYYPMASQVLLQPARVSPAGFVDAAPHRQALHAVYNQYQRCSQDPFYTAATEDLQALLRPLFITSFLIDDFLADNDFFSACAGGQTGTLLLSSASSKTAWGTAFQLAQRPGVSVVGLTSPGNVAFCESLGCYSRVLGYDQLDQIAADTPCVYIDFAGDAGLRQRIHARFGELNYSSSIGGTHVEQLAAPGESRNLPGPRPVLFFAPAQIKKRSADWGAHGLGARLLQAWQAFTARVSDTSSPWLVVQRQPGRQAIEQAYREVLAGRGDPRIGHILLP